MNFHTELKSLISKTELKNSTLAQAVQYDESYVSKWLSGRAVPSEKNIDKIVNRIADCIMQEASESVKAELCTQYDVDAAGLPGIIKETLLSAYRGEAVTESLTFTESEQLLTVVQDMDVSSECYLVADLLSMDHESRLLLAGIKNGGFTGTRSGKVSYLIDLDVMSDVIYDPIYLVHLLTSCSFSQFNLYGSKMAAGKLLYSDGKRKVISAMLSGESYCMAVTRREDTESAERLATIIRGLCTQESLLFGKVESLLDDHFYMNSLLSSKLNWLTGHFTEQLIPEDVFSAFAESEEERRIGSMLKTRTARANLLIYRAAFSKLIISGELDFFGRPVMLTPAQQLSCMEYVYSLAENGTVRIVDGGFSTDFRYVSDPCVFLSDTVDYLRLENGIDTYARVEDGRYKDNLLRILDKGCSQMYHRFFEKAWDVPDTVISEKEAVMDLIRSYMEQIIE